MKKAILGVALLFWAIPCAGTTITLKADGSGDYPTIQAAIDDANDGDTIIVSPGIYTGDGNRDIDFKGKAVTVKSQEGPESCIIKCEGSEETPHRGFTFKRGEQADSVLTGVTITNGYVEYGEGGAIHCPGSSPTIARCIITRNSGKGAIYASGEPTIIDCIISDNYSSGLGGGIYYAALIGDPTIANCTIVYNTAYRGGGIYSRRKIKLTNCILWGNTAETWPQVSRADISYSNIEGGWTGEGNIDADPLFVNLLAGDYHILADSPCLNTGDPCTTPMPGQTDVDDEPRIFNGRVDMGADEYPYEGPVVAVRPPEINAFVDDRSGEPNVFTLSVSNNGIGTFAWQVTDSSPWLEITPSRGMCSQSQDPCQITLNIDASGLDTGLHTGRFTLTADDAANSPRVVPVYLHYGILILRVPSQYQTIQEAIDDANDGDTIIVSPGTYTGDGNRDIDFKGKAITVRSINPEDPYIVAATVIDGEGDYDCCQNAGYWRGQCEQHRGFNFRSGEGPDSVLAGFTITRFCAPDEVPAGRYPPEPPSPAGGGIFCEDSSPTITHCVITDNWANRRLGGYDSGGDGGGGIHSQGGHPTIAYCTITRNIACWAAGGIDCSYGPAQISHSTIQHNWSNWATGGISGGTVITNCIIKGNSGWYGAGGISSGGLITDCTISNNGTGDGGGGGRGRFTITNCVIKDNGTRDGAGGGLYCYEGARVSGCSIVGNSARSYWEKGDGSGVYCQGPNIVITACTIADNYADWTGGGIYCKEPNIVITECTIARNFAEITGAGIQGPATVINSIVWDNNAPDDPHISGDATVSFSDIQGGFPGIGNIDVDPVFADAEQSDFHLRSQAGRWDPNSQAWVVDDVTSQCIDTADPLTPIGAEPFPNGGIANLGAYAGTAQASKSYFDEPVCQIIIAGDINGDCTVNFLDFRLMALHWLDEM